MALQPPPGCRAIPFIGAVMRMASHITTGIDRGWRDRVDYRKARSSDMTHPRAPPLKDLLHLQRARGLVIGAPVEAVLEGGPCGAGGTRLPARFVLSQLPAQIRGPSKDCTCART